MNDGDVKPFKRPDSYTGYGYNIRLKVGFVSQCGCLCGSIRPTKIPLEYIVNLPDTVHTDSAGMFAAPRIIGRVSAEEGARIDAEELAKINFS